MNSVRTILISDPDKVSGVNTGNLISGHLCICFQAKTRKGRLKPAFILTNPEKRGLTAKKEFLFRDLIYRPRYFFYYLRKFSRGVYSKLKASATSLYVILPSTILIPGLIPSLSIAACFQPLFAICTA